MNQRGLPNPQKASAKPRNNSLNTVSGQTESIARTRKTNPVVRVGVGCVCVGGLCVGVGGWLSVCGW